MCVGSLARLVDVWNEDGVRVGRIDDGCIVPLLYVPDARPGEQLLLHLGIPVEVVEVDDGTKGDEP